MYNFSSLLDSIMVDLGIRKSFCRTTVPRTTLSFVVAASWTSYRHIRPQCNVSIFFCPVWRSLLVPTMIRSLLKHWSFILHDSPSFSSGASSPPSPVGTHWNTVIQAKARSILNTSAKRQTAGNRFPHRPKIRFSTQDSGLVALIQVKLGGADGHLGPLGRAKFHLNRWNFKQGVGMQPRKYQKFPLFGKESPPRGEPPDQFLKFLGTSNCRTLGFQIWRHSLHR